MFGDRRGLLARTLDVCFGVFVAAVLLYVAVQLVASVKWWLLGGLVAIGLGGLGVGIIRFRGERW